MQGMASEVNRWVNIKKRLGPGIKENLPNCLLDGFLGPIRVLRTQRCCLELSPDQYKRSAACNFCSGDMACSIFFNSGSIVATIVAVSLSTLEPAEQSWRERRSDRRVGRTVGVEPN